MRRLVLVLLVSQTAVVLKQIFEGTAWSILFALVLLAGTSIFFFYLHVKPLISPEKFPDEMEQLDSVMLAHWWHHYKHPLIASNLQDEETACKLG